MRTTFRRTIAGLVGAATLLVAPTAASAAEPPSPRAWTFQAMACNSDVGRGIHVHFQAPSTTGETDYLLDTKLYRGNPDKGGVGVADFNDDPYLAIGGSFDKTYTVPAKALKSGHYFVQQTASVAWLSTDPHVSSRVLDRSTPKEIFAIK